VVSVEVDSTTVRSSVKSQKSKALISYIYMNLYE
jgi:hypothetical protein